MTASQQQFFNSLFTDEHACVSYLFNKRWPMGFTCPFCGVVQPEVAPAYTVVCRYCRKQTSITAKTLMHGSKKNLVSWMRVVWQFCSRDEGISAKEIQHLMSLSSYHTAWRWLKKIRLAAAVADSSRCCGSVLIQVIAPGAVTLPENIQEFISQVLELECSGIHSGRVRFLVLHSLTPASIHDVLNQIIEKDATVYFDDEFEILGKYIANSRDSLLAGPYQIQQGQQVMNQVSEWLSRVYRGAIETRYLQSYLDEFCFRYNTASWSDRVRVMDHLLTGLVSEVGDHGFQDKARQITDGAHEQ